jgi:uncharacterized protein
MLQVRTYLDKSQIHGLGVFAAESIKRGQLIWKFNSSIDKIIEKRTGFTKFEIEFINTYAYFDKQLGNWILPVDNDRFTNHSDNPNTIPHNNGNVVAAKDIIIGEEFTINYYDIDEYAREKLLDIDKNVK